MTPRDAALRALSAYVARGRAALAHFAEGEVDAALAVLSHRQAAFHNYAAIEARATRDGWVPGEDAEAASLIRDAVADQTALADAVEQARLSLGRQLVRFDSARGYAEACHSGGNAAPRLRRSA